MKYLGALLFVSSDHVFQDDSCMVYDHHVFFSLSASLLSAEQYTFLFHPSILVIKSFHTIFCLWSLSLSYPNMIEWSNGSCFFAVARRGEIRRPILSLYILAHILIHTFFSYFEYSVPKYMNKRSIPRYLAVVGHQSAMWP